MHPETVRQFNAANGIIAQTASIRRRRFKRRIVARRNITATNYAIDIRRRLSGNAFDVKVFRSDAMSYSKFIELSYLGK